MLRLNTSTPSDVDDLAGRIKALAAEAGFVACGFTTADPFPGYAKAIEERMRLFPECRELYASHLARAEPRGHAPWARSIVVGVRWYGHYRLPEETLGHIGRTYLADRRYSGCPDFPMSRSFKAGLKALGLRVKTGGPPARAAAVRAGVARWGRNGFVYGDNGSWINVETWLVDAELPAGAPNEDPVCPAGCRACMDACPTGAIVKPGVVCGSRCVAYLTYGAPPPIPEDLWRSMGGWIYGCDACQEVCPLNRGEWVERDPAPWLEEVRERLTPEALAAMDEAAYLSAIHPRFWYLPADAGGLARWHANARRAAKEADQPRRHGGTEWGLLKGG